MTDQDETDSPHPELTFELPRGLETWGHCPECRKPHIEIRMKELDINETAPHQSNIVVWLECLSCQHESRLMAGDPVEQPEWKDDYVSPVDWLKQWVSKHV